MLAWHDTHDPGRPEGPPVLLHTRIPEDRKVAGLEYGAHETLPAIGRTAYYVRPETGAYRWGLAVQTPAEDELQPDDAGILHAIEEELEEARP